MKIYISEFIVAPPTKYVNERHAGLDPASRIFLDSRLCGNDNHYCRGNKISGDERV